MSDRSDKSTFFSRRGGANRRQRRRVEPKLRQEKPKPPLGERLQPRGNSKRPVGPSPVPMKRSLSTRSGRIPPPPAAAKSNNSKVRRLQAVPSPKGRGDVRQKQINPMAKSLLYAMRLLILGVGIGAIAGTLLSILDPATKLPAAVKSPPALVESQQQPANNGAVTPSPLSLNQELAPLKTAILTLMSKSPNLKAGVFLADLDTGAYVDISSIETFAAASTIKIPLLVAFFQDVDEGKIRLDESMTLEQAMIASGSGDMQYKPIGTQYTALDVATKMIVISDNTATNMLITKLGGAAALNQRFRSWGLVATQIRNLLPDLEGTNTTSPRDLANLIALVNQGKLVSLRSRDRLLDIMHRTERNTMLPRGLGEGATIAHKTGDIGTMLGDAGLVDMPTGKRYIAVVMIKRPHNDPAAQELIRAISSTAYMQLSEPVTAPPLAGSTPGASNTPFTGGSSQ